MDPNSGFFYSTYYTGWPINIRFRYLEDVYEESIVIVLETIPYNDNIGLKIVGVIIGHF